MYSDVNSKFEGIYSLSVASLRFVATVEEETMLPRYIGSALRGAFGHALKGVACLYKEQGRPCENCTENREALAEGRATHCVYGYIFETPRPRGATMHERQREVPHPYVIRPVDFGGGGQSAEQDRNTAGDERRVYTAGDRIVFEAQLFGKGIDHVGPVVEASMRMARRGLGVGRGVLEVREVLEMEPFGAAHCTLPFCLDRSTLGLVGEWDDAMSRVKALAPGMVALQFLTPTHLVRDHYAVRVPTFPVLARALLRRLTALALFHGGAAADGEVTGKYFARLARQAEAVRLVDWHGDWREWERYSTRQDRRMVFGGVLGTAVYEGNVAEFLPYLVYGQAAHVGKQTTFGAGRYRIVGGGMLDV
jgi:hypothetical protein